MFPSSNNGNVDPIYYSNQQGYNINRPFFSDITCNSKHEDEAPLPFFHLPSSPFNTCYDEFEFFHHQNQEVILEQQQPLKGIFDTSTIVDIVESVKNINNTNNELMMNRISNCNTNCKEQIPRKRCSKRDRHSKINTAQGPRDRRMRLSLKVAREFFDLQDKLCFDKASKTVEWLLIQARPAIKKLCGTTNGLQVNNYSCSIGDKSASSTSECEVVSGLIDQDDESVAAIKCSINLCKSKSSSCVNNNKGKRVKPSRKITFHPLARESREKARARARERTREKQKWSRRIDESNKPCEGEAAKGRESFNQLSCWSPFETGEESATQSHTMNPSSMEVEVPIISRLVTNETMIDESLAIMGKWSPSSIINHLYNSGFPQEHQITDFQSFSKPWEA